MRIGEHLGKEIITCTFVFNFSYITIEDVHL